MKFARELTVQEWNGNSQRTRGQSGQYKSERRRGEGPMRADGRRTSGRAEPVRPRARSSRLCLGRSGRRSRRSGRSGRGLSGLLVPSAVGLARLLVRVLGGLLVALLVLLLLRRLRVRSRGRRNTFVSRLPLLRSGRGRGGLRHRSRGIRLCLLDCGGRARVRTRERQTQKGKGKIDTHLPQGWAGSSAECKQCRS